MIKLINKSGYIFTDKKNPKSGIMSMALGSISVISVFLALYLTVRNGGDAPMKYGTVILLSIVYAGIGLILGIRSLSQKDIYRFFPTAGILFNAIAFAECGFILYLGVTGI